MMMTEMAIETSVQYVHLTRLIAREDWIKFTRRESTKTYNEYICLLHRTHQLLIMESETERDRISETSECYFLLVWHYI